MSFDQFSKLRLLDRARAFSVLQQALNVLVLEDRLDLDRHLLGSSCLWARRPKHARSQARDRPRQLSSPSAHENGGSAPPERPDSRSSPFWATGWPAAISTASSRLPHSRMSKPPTTSLVSANGPSVTIVFPSTDADGAGSARRSQLVASHPDSAGLEIVEPRKALVVSSVTRRSRLGLSVHLLRVPAHQHQELHRPSPSSFWYQPYSLGRNRPTQIDTLMRMHGNLRYVKSTWIGLLALLAFSPPAQAEVVTQKADRGVLAVAADGSPCGGVYGRARSLRVAPWQRRAAGRRSASAASPPTAGSRSRGSRSENVRIVT